MRALTFLLRISAPIFFLVGALHLAYGVGADALLGAKISAETLLDPALNSQNRFYGVAFTVYRGAPRSVAILECITLPAALSLAGAFWRSVANASEWASVAPRGVAFFFLVAFMELLGFVVPLPWRIWQ